VFDVAQRRRLGGRMSWHRQLLADGGRDLQGQLWRFDLHAVGAQVIEEGLAGGR
jgi:hypothetical protein